MIIISVFAFIIELSSQTESYESQSDYVSVSVQAPYQYDGLTKEQKDKFERELKWKIYQYKEEHGTDKILSSTEIKGKLNEEAKLIVNEILIESECVKRLMRKGTKEMVAVSACEI